MIELYEQRIADLRKYGAEDDPPVDINEPSYNAFKIFCETLPHNKKIFAYGDDGSLRLIMTIPTTKRKIGSYTFSTTFINETTTIYVNLKTMKCETVSLMKLINTIMNDKELYEHLEVLK